MHLGGPDADLFELAVNQTADTNEEPDINISGASTSSIKVDPDTEGSDHDPEASGSAAEVSETPTPNTPALQPFQPTTWKLSAAVLAEVIESRYPHVAVVDLRKLSVTTIAITEQADEPYAGARSKQRLLQQCRIRIRHGVSAACPTKYSLSFRYRLLSELWGTDDWAQSLTLSPRIGIDAKAALVIRAPELPQSDNKATNLFRSYARPAHVDEVHIATIGRPYSLLEVTRTLRQLDSDKTPVSWPVTRLLIGGGHEMSASPEDLRFFSNDTLARNLRFLSVTFPSNEQLPKDKRLMPLAELLASVNTHAPQLEEFIAWNVYASADPYAPPTSVSRGSRVKSLHFGLEFSRAEQRIPSDMTNPAFLVYRYVARGTAINLCFDLEGTEHYGPCMDALWTYVALTTCSRYFGYMTDEQCNRL